MLWNSHTLAESGLAFQNSPFLSIFLYCDIFQNSLLPIILRGRTGLMSCHCYRDNLTVVWMQMCKATKRLSVSALWDYEDRNPLCDLYAGDNSPTIQLCLEFKLLSSWLSNVLTPLNIIIYLPLPVIRVMRASLLRYGSLNFKSNYCVSSRYLNRVNGWVAKSKLIIKLPTVGMN